MSLSTKNRQGAAALLVVIMLIPLVAMVAFAVDLGYIWRTDAELQNAADAAALAGTATLMDANVRANDAQPPLTAAQIGDLRKSATLHAIEVAKEFGEQHSAGGVRLDINSSDVTVGYIEDPTALATSTKGAFRTSSESPFPNTVRVVVRRDDTVASGKLGLYFAGVFGMSEVDRSAAAAATLRGGNIGGFQGAVPMLPIAMNLETYKWLTGRLATPPEGVDSQDDFTVKTENHPPVTSGPDGQFEARVFSEKPAGSSESSLGTVSLDRHDRNPGASDLSRWIRDGMTAAETKSWNSATNDRGIYATPTNPLWMDAKPGVNAGMKDELADRIGKPAIMPVFDLTNGKSGSNEQFRVVGFVSVVIVDVDLTGSKKSKHVTVQLSGTMTDNAIQADGTTGMPGSAIYKGASLSR